MSEKTLYEQLQDLSHSNKYCSPLKLDRNFIVFNSQFDSALKSAVEIFPPDIHLSISKQTCFTSIKNDIDKSRRSREGFLKSYSKGSTLNQIIYSNDDEGIGSIQESQQCLCVGFSIIKDTYKDCLSKMTAQLRLCLMKEKCLIDRSNQIPHTQVGQVSKLINKNLRIFLLFDTKTNPDKIILHKICFYPHVQFNAKLIKLKACKIAPSTPFEKIQSQQMQEDYGFLSLDQKKRLLFIEKDDPNFSETALIGMWVYGSFATSRTKKQYSRNDCLWALMLEFYMNSQIKRCVSVVGKNNGLLCFIDRSSNRINPLIYSFEIKKNSKASWAFYLKSEILESEEQIKQIKMDLSSLAIIEEKQYSEISENFSRQEPYNKNQNINRQNENSLHFQEISRSEYASQLNKSQKNYDEKDLQIRTLQVELEFYKNKCQQLDFYKNRCRQLESMLNPLYMQSMMFNNQMMIQNPQPPSYFMHSHPPAQGFPVPKENIMIHPNSNINNPSGSEHTCIKQEKKEEKSPQYCFSEDNQEQITFSSQQKKDPERDRVQIEPVENSSGTNPFQKKQHSQQHSSYEQKKTIDEENKKNNPNISFQDQFGYQFQNGEEEKNSVLHIEKHKSFQEDLKKVQRSPEFKKIQSSKIEDLYKKEDANLEQKRKQSLDSDSSEGKRNHQLTQRISKQVDCSSQSDSDDDEKMRRLRVKYNIKKR